MILGLTIRPPWRGRKYRGTGISRNICIGYRKRRCRRCGVRAGLLPTRRVFCRTYPCEPRSSATAREQSVATVGDVDWPNGEDKFFIVGAVEERHEPLLPDANKLCLF